MTPFFDGRAPIPGHWAIVGGPERRTDIVALASGREVRNAPRAHALRRYELSGAFASLDEMAALIAFFEARRGPLQAFRFRDPADDRSCAPSSEPAATDQRLGAGDGERRAFALRKTYGAGPDAYVRPIVKPIVVGIVAAVAGVATTGFHCNEATSEIVFDAPPTAGAEVSAGFRFDTPVRFEADRLELERDAFGAGRASKLVLREVLL